MDTGQQQGIEGDPPLAHLAEAPQTERSSAVRPHRATLILLLGILALALFLSMAIPYVAVSFPCGILAWVLGRRDLKEMAAGRMYSSGHDLTQVGLICGIVATVLAILWGLWLAGLALAG